LTLFLKAVYTASAAAFLMNRSPLLHLTCPIGVVESLWSGALSPTPAKVNARLNQDSDQVRLVISSNADLSGAIHSDLRSAQLTVNNRMVVMPVSGLTPNTQYYYGVESQGVVDPATPGQLRTPAVGAFSFTFAFSACAETGSEHLVFETIQ
jgi:phosphodiesterase/alkaline phosphatase D-like protein